MVDYSNTQEQDYPYNTDYEDAETGDLKVLTPGERAFARRDYTTGIELRDSDKCFSSTIPLLLPPLTVEEASMTLRGMKPSALHDKLVQRSGYNHPAASKAYHKYYLQQLIDGGHDFGTAYAWHCIRPVGAKRLEMYDDTLLSTINPNGLLDEYTHLNYPKPVIVERRGFAAMENPLWAAPRRVWHLHSNRVVPWDWCLGGNRCLPLEAHGAESMPGGWAISHSWTADMEAVSSPINRFEWPVPVPRGVSLDSVRQELLQRNAKYCWVDVLCLRQQSDNPERESLRLKEWKVDVPTTGNVYRRVENILTYYNSLGRPFNPSPDRVMTTTG